MNFYQRLSAYYDQVFPISEDVFAMLKATFAPGDRVLDIACGTGTYSLPLAGAGFKVTAFDLHPVMVEKARRKAAEGSPDRPAEAGPQNPFYLVGSMERLADIQCGPFDGVFCIGNSLVHLPDRGSVASFLKDLWGILKPGGRAVIQIINYDRIIDRGIPGLPDLSAPGVTFERRYTVSPDKQTVAFRTRLIIERPKGGPEILEQEITLLALRFSELESALKKAGFTNLRACGSFAGADFDIDASIPLIFKARSRP